MGLSKMIWLAWLEGKSQMEWHIMNCFKFAIEILWYNLQDPVNLVIQNLPYLFTNSISSATFVTFYIYLYTLKCKTLLVQKIITEMYVMYNEIN